MNKKLFWSIVAVLVFAGFGVGTYAYMSHAKEHISHAHTRIAEYRDIPVIKDVKAEDEVVLDTSDSSEPEQNYVVYDAPVTSGFKSYMDYRTITDETSLQYVLQNEYAYTGNYGIRMVDDRYCIALGSYFTSDIGQYVDLILENGIVIPCVLSDQKADVHTDENNMVTVHSDCLTEFIIAVDCLDDTVELYGDISYCCDEWSSRVVQVVVYDKNILYE